MIDSFSHFLDIKSSSNRLIFKYYIYCHFTPSCLGCIHGKSERVPRFGFSCVLLIRYLKCNSNGWIQVSINNWSMICIQITTNYCLLTKIALGLKTMHLKGLWSISWPSYVTWILHSPASSGWKDAKKVPFSSLTGHPKGRSVGE